MVEVWDVGQYFIIVNLDKKEYIKPAVLKLWEICANNDCRILPYLLATNNQDGTGLMKAVKGELDEIKKKIDLHKYKILHYNKEYKYAIVEKRLKYFGRWCGDRIAVVGDYADVADNYDGPLYHEILEKFKDITKEAIKEFNEFIEEEDLKIR